MRIRGGLGTFLAAGMLTGMAATRLPAQPIDPAVVGERIQRLTAAVESLELSMASQKRQIDALAGELVKIREEMGRQGDAMRQRDARPWADDLKRLADAIAEVDRKRASDGEQVVRVLNELKKAVATGPDTSRSAKAPEPRTTPGRTKAPDADKPAEKPPDRALEYVLERGQSLSEVVVSFNEEAKKQGYQPLTTAQVMKFNDIKDDRRIPVGARILLPVIPAR
jgi:hypothetical protein